MDHRRSLIPAGALAAAGVLFWRGTCPRPSSRVTEPAPESIAPREPPVANTLDQPIAVAVRPPPLHLEEPEPSPAPSPTPDNEYLIAGPNQEDHVPGAKPHPITPDHVRIQEEISLFKSAADALAARDVPAIRRMVAEHRASYPDQNQDMADGYEIAADCIESPGASSTARARRFFEEETYSMMRRPILRTCLEAQR